jgi:hypothetical protein
MNLEQTINDNLTDYEWILFQAENGHSSYQYFLASEIHSKSQLSDRIIQTYKWIFLAYLLGEAKAKEVAHFVYLGMSQTQINCSEKLIEEWISDKANADEKRDKSGWSKELITFLEESENSS